MKVSVSVPDEDIEFLDNYAKTHRVASRSAALQRAIRLVRASELTDSYAAAFTEWSDDPDNAAWDTATADASCVAVRSASSTLTLSSGAKLRTRVLA